MSILPSFCLTKLFYPFCRQKSMLKIKNIYFLYLYKIKKAG
nr:MAG TPA: hypothetical protein [Caudoviricetes sp.]